MPTPSSNYWQGFQAGLPFLLVIAPFGTLFGVLATEAGLTVFETLSFSVVVIAGAAQFVSLQMLQDHVPTLIVLASALAVNLRMAMYSAAITPHLGGLPLWKRALSAYFLVDQTYAASALEFEKHPEKTLAQKFAFFMGAMTPICPPWYAFTLLGAWLGEAVPADFGLDFALPIAFLAMIAPALRTGAHVVAALVATLATLLLAFLPYNLGVLCAATLGMAAGAETERRMQK
ncbi:AzlC family ABC transporter permease [Alloyangia pacifica]|uniref:Predicted branched-chain amino acid permease (Azaleucine resistance) n=1 Tax=Alloyangia pacifica TaxID=311180 RepID=A0A1I6WI90_9RHOB|nr:AzlC family ABC transporter permease [Alloyangia pacifica]SDI78988.1 Predicted branched-chain amino acid permease (azaleucine resistance) [Alloyangia pacifica]SFT25712.1 Predicted branched-chain amino acid permease (azaleucine resistance) [Alloyangia pacifica]